VPAPWRWLLPSVIQGSEGPRLAFDVTQTTPESALLGLPRRMLDTDVLHVRARSDHGIIGRSVISRASGAVDEGLEITRAATAMWRNGLRPSAVLTFPTFLDDVRRKRFRDETLPELTGALNAGKTPLLEGGMDLKQSALSSVDAEFLATRQLNTSQIAALFSIPEVLLHIGQRLPTDMAPFITQFAQLALAPIVTAIETEFSYSVLPGGMRLVLDLDGLMRGSFSSMVAALAALKQSGVISANDARAELDWPPIAGGDVLSVGPPPSWPADGPGSQHLGPSPGATGSGVPEPGTNQNGGSG
jgi:HK97 family phage portal protein